MYVSLHECIVEVCLCLENPSPLSSGESLCFIVVVVTEGTHPLLYHYLLNAGGKLLRFIPLLKPTLLVICPCPTYLF